MSAMGLVSVMIGLRVSRMIVSGMRALTLPAKSVAWKLSVCGPSAVPFVAKVVGNVKLPWASKGMGVGRTCKLEACTTRDFTPTRLSRTRPMTVTLAGVTTPSGGADSRMRGAWVSAAALNVLRTKLASWRPAASPS